MIWKAMPNPLSPGGMASSSVCARGSTQHRQDHETDRAGNPITIGYCAGIQRQTISILEELMTRRVHERCRRSCRPRRRRGSMSIDG